MQPYFLPYIGYFQLIRAADAFVVYDNIQYTKKGWINRNRMLVGGQSATFSLPLKKDSDYLDVRERELADSFNPTKLLNQIRGAYAKAPCFEMVYPLVQEILGFGERNLFQFILHSLKRVCTHLGLDTRFVVSSTVDVDHSLRGRDKVLAICKTMGADSYINPMGGIGLYSKEDFQAEGIELQFVRPGRVEYRQFGNEFIPWLSILDVLMFNSVDEAKGLVDTGYDLI